MKYDDDEIKKFKRNEKEKRELFLIRNLDDNLDDWIMMF